MDADYKIVDKTIVTREFRVKLPLDWKNFGFILHQVELLLETDNRIQWDDACEVTAEDDEYLVFSWPVDSE